MSNLKQHSIFLNLKRSSERFLLYYNNMGEFRLGKLQSIIDELRLESRKIEYSSALDRLTKRVDKLELQIEAIKTIIKQRYE